MAHSMVLFRLVLSWIIILTKFLIPSSSTRNSFASRWQITFVLSLVWLMVSSLANARLYGLVSSVSSKRRLKCVYHYSPGRWPYISFCRLHNSLGISQNMPHIIMARPHLPRPLLIWHKTLWEVTTSISSRPTVSTVLVTREGRTMPRPGTSSQSRKQ